jgi:hypothetical protein
MSPPSTRPPARMTRETGTSWLRRLSRAWRVISDESARSLDTRALPLQFPLYSDQTLERLATGQKPAVSETLSLLIVRGGIRDGQPGVLFLA